MLKIRFLTLTDLERPQFEFHIKTTVVPNFAKAVLASEYVVAALVVEVTGAEDEL